MMMKYWKLRPNAKLPLRLANCYARMSRNYRWPLSDSNLGFNLSVKLWAKMSESNSTAYQASVSENGSSATFSLNCDDTSHGISSIPTDYYQEPKTNRKFLGLVLSSRVTFNGSYWRLMNLSSSLKDSHGTLAMQPIPCHQISQRDLYLQGPFWIQGALKRKHWAPGNLSLDS